MQYFTLSNKLSEKTEQRSFMFRLAYINHIDYISKKRNIAVNVIINEALDYSLYSNHFKVNSDIKYDESKYLDNDITIFNRSVRIRKDLYNKASYIAKSNNISVNKVINEAIKFALVNYREKEKVL